MKRKTTTPNAISGEKIEILTAEEVSLRLRLPLSTVYYLAKTGALPGFQVGRSWRFYSSELDQVAHSKPAKPRILVVDDDAVTRHFIKELLTSRNYTVAEAGDVDEALAAIQCQRFDMFLVDFQMPGKDGMEFIRKITGGYSLRQIVVITAFADLAQADELFSLGALTLLRKPLDPDRLLECVEWILGTNQPGKNFSITEKIARPGQEQPAISACTKQSLQPTEPAADLDRQVGS